MFLLIKTKYMYITNPLLPSPPNPLHKSTPTPTLLPPNSIHSSTPYTLNTYPLHSCGPNLLLSSALIPLYSSTPKPLAL